MLVPTPLAELYDVFENSSNLKKITPPWLSFSVTSKDKVVMRRSVEIDYRFRPKALNEPWGGQAKISFPVAAAVTAR